MRLIIFCRLLGMVLCGNAVTVYFASDSIRLAVFTTLALWLVLQVAYFASILFLIWRSSGVGGEQTAELFGRSQKARFPSPDNDEVRNEHSDLRQRNQMLGIALLLP
ncbi:exopolysaccharide production repressor protein [Mesorhizobium sp. WSM1293]|uniref:exopolysaccharide production repressor protein n=1 Tax=Mesorhizobium sp. WSM1293 TaxID=1040984 RepID=UPI000487D511|nr:exopolysaccharide production repressor protein [Mesorhizobium sp. WSM1293]